MYLVVDRTDNYEISVFEYDTEEEMLEAIQDKDIREIDVYDANEVMLTTQKRVVIKYG